jgi:hypothetical protein
MTIPHDKSRTLADIYFFIYIFFHLDPFNMPASFQGHPDCIDDLRITPGDSEDEPSLNRVGLSFIYALTLAEG